MRKKLSTFCKLFISLVLKWHSFKLTLDIQKIGNKCCCYFKSASQVKFLQCDLDYVHV